MKPTEHTAKPVATPRTGRFAALRGLLHARGSGASLRALIATPLIILGALFALVALTVGVAQAEAPQLISYGTFSVERSFGVAVDNSTLGSSGDVYVTGLLASDINEFDASGKRISPPSPFGSGSGFYSGAAVNPTDGDVYVVDARGQEIGTYAPSSGALLSSFPVSECANGLSGNYIWEQIATDSAGDVYLACGPKNEVEVFNSSGGAPSGAAQTIGGSGAHALREPTGVAVAPSGDVWVADAGNGRIEEFSPSGTFLSEIKSEGVRTVAVDPHGDVFALVHNTADFCGTYTPPCYHLLEYGPSGAQLADIGAGAIGATAPFEEFGVTDMLAIDDATGRVYVTDGERALVWIYGPPTAATIERELATEVSTSEAKLGAQVNPGGIATRFRFEYGTTAAYGHTAPFPEGNAGQGVSARTVWASANGLEPGTTYHYRVVATNALGTVVGADQTFTTETAAETSCPNEALRSGFSANLPDCRAYELVSTPTDTSNQPESVFFGPPILSGAASREGDRLSYGTAEPLPGAPTGGLEYIATRGASGWSSEDAVPLQSYTGDRCPFTDAGTLAYSPDLAEGLLYVGGGEVFEGRSLGNGTCGAEGVEVVPGEPLGYENLLLRDNTNATYRLINVAPAGVTPANAKFEGASADLGHVIFDEHAALTPNAPPGVEDLYEWSEGTLRLVTVLPDGTPVQGSIASEPVVPTRLHSVSADGSRVLFTANGRLYVRLHGESTVQVDASQGSGAGGGAEFVDASADGSKVFFKDESKLTPDSTAESGKPDLYLCELPEGAKACTLTDLTVAQAGEHGDVQGGMVGIAEDGSYAYFVASGILAGAQANERGETAQSEQPNLYLYREGAVTFIATLVANGDDYCVTEGCARVSPNGQFLAFISHRSLTGYDNIDVKSGEPDSEIYLYDAGTGALVCASCNPSGEAPTGNTKMFARLGGMGPHFLSDSGRLFFETPDGLLPSDTNGQTDVYEYESGRLHLISTGTSSAESLLIDASENGDDVFILTRQKLLAQDTNEEALSIYDARVDGGFAEQLAPPACTTADACRAPVSPQPSIYGAPSSQTFSGVGNLAPPSEVGAKVGPKSKAAKCRRGSVKKADKCVKRLKKKAKKSAHANKRTGK